MGGGGVGGLHLTIYMQGRACHAKIAEAAEKAAGQIGRYEGATNVPVSVSEGENHPALSWLAPACSWNWSKPAAEVEAYNNDFQVCISNFIACNTCYTGSICKLRHSLIGPHQLAGSAACEVYRMQEGKAAVQVFAEAEGDSPPDSGRASSRSNADSARMSHRYPPTSLCATVPLAAIASPLS